MSIMLQRATNSSSRCFNNANNKDFFCGVFENNLSRNLTLNFAVISAPFIILAFYSIIWYERHGHDSKRTIIDKLFSSTCWAGIEYTVLVIIPDAIRYNAGPFPPSICS